MSDIEARVKKIIAEQLGVDESQVTSEASFMDDLGADSLDTVELVMALEEEFGVTAAAPVAVAAVGAAALLAATPAVSAPAKRDAGRSQPAGQSRDVEQGEVPKGGEVIFPAQLPTLKQVAEQLVNEAISRAGGNQTVAARLLGVTRPALSKRLKNLSVGEGL